MFSKFVKSSFMTLGLASVISLAPVVLGGAPATAQIADGDLTEYEATTPYLGYGSEGAAVEDVQMFLREQGYYNGPIDGVYGSGTRAAVLGYQEDYGLASDGIIGENTWGSLTSFGENETEVERDQDWFGDDEIEIERE